MVLVANLSCAGGQLVGVKHRLLPALIQTSQFVFRTSDSRDLGVAPVVISIGIQ